MFCIRRDLKCKLPINLLLVPLIRVLWQIEAAVSVFYDEMIERDRFKPNLWLYKELIKILARVGYTHMAFALFKKVRAPSTPYSLALSRYLLGMFLCICLTINKWFNKAWINVLLIVFNISQCFNTSIKRFFHWDKIYNVTIIQLIIPII